MSLFKKIFQSTPNLPLVDLSIIGTDFHSHLIPGIDDGSPDMESSIEMIRKFKDLGYKKLITTPHIMCDYYKNTPEIILSGLEKVRNELFKLNINIEIEAASEYNLDDGLNELIGNKNILTFGDNYVLFELPFMNEPRNLQEIIFNFQTAGYKPILAHPERYGFWNNNLDKFEELKAKGVMLQLNLLSLTGHYSPEVKKMAEKLVIANLIDAIGSDCHRIEHLFTIEENLNNKFIHQLVNQENLLNKKL